MSVTPISQGFGPIATPQSLPQLGGSASDGLSFTKVMSDAMDGVQGLQDTAHASANRFLSGETEELHQVALDQQKAAIGLDLFLQVRNKVVSAYQEIMKMQI